MCRILGLFCNLISKFLFLTYASVHWASRLHVESGSMFVGRWNTCLGKVVLFLLAQLGKSSGFRRHITCTAEEL